MNQMAVLSDLPRSQVVFWSAIAGSNGAALHHWRGTPGSICSSQIRFGQYGLVDRGRELGWSDVQVIDEDLGRSGDGTARPGFEGLLAGVCEGRVGAVL
jgi:hypothetical protein